MHFGNHLELFDLGVLDHVVSDIFGLGHILVHFSRAMDYD